MAILRTWSEVMRLATLALSVSSIISSAFGGDAPLGASFIFGDSLVDAGNNNYLSTLSKADIKPNGIDFTASGGRPTGRYTNGRTIGDIVGEELGQPNYALPFLAPNTTGKAILSGVNYASGGGGIMNATGRIFVNRLGMDVQIDYFNITRKQIDGLLGASKARDYIMKNSIFSITVGANDFLNNYLLPTPDGFIDDMLSHFRAQLTRLYQMDAKKFVIGNVGPIGCIPYQKTINQLQENECVDLANKLAPGFSTATRACCGNGGQFAGIVPCGPTSSMCKDRSKHVFWDPYHPSEAANLIIAKQLLDGDTKYMSPMNLRQLRNH
ncbi:GDSL esterase/lipase At2g23540 [Linum grandiflorum]